MQIQDDFSGASLSLLARLGLAVYRFLPDFRQRCPICHGKNCAVRHGLYRRRVVDRNGAFHELFPIPRFRCRQRGPKPSPSATFSVLPTGLVPRRLSSLSLMQHVVELLLETRLTGRQVLDTLSASTHGSARPWFPESPSLYRILHLFARAADQLGTDRSTTPNGCRPSGIRERAGFLSRRLRDPQRASRLVISFHQSHFPRLLFGAS